MLESEATRVRTQLNPQYDDSSDEDCGEKVPCELVVSGSDSAEVLDAPEHALNEVTLAVGDSIVGNWDFSCRVTGDDGLGPPFGDQVAQRHRVIGFVGKQPGEGSDRRDQSRGNRNIAGVARRQRQDQRAALLVRQSVDLGGAPAS